MIVTVPAPVVSKNLLIKSAMVGGGDSQAEGVGKLTPDHRML